jgi:branched-chain amino acid transport system substrate-binding protein
MDKQDTSADRREEQEWPGLTEGKPVSRRHFLKLAGLAGGAVGLGVGLGGLAAACGEAESTTTTGAPTTVAPSTTTTAPSTTTTVGVEAGRSIKLGYVLPVTGALAPFGIGKDWVLKLFADAVGDGVVLADNKKHPFEVVTKDAESDSNRAAQVTGDLIQGDKVDLVISVGSPEMTNPSADTAEALGCPSLSSFTEWHAFTQGRSVKAEGFKWTYMFGWGSDSNAAAFIGMCKQIQSNSTLGLIFANDSDGNSWMQFAPTVFQQVGGFNVVTTDLYTPGAEDYTAQISKFKKEGCDLLVGSMLVPDFTNFWKQAHQQSFLPKVACISKALLFPGVVKSLGDVGYNLCAEGSWAPSLTYTEPLTGMTCRQLADSYEASTGQQWDETLCQIMLFGWAVDIFKRATDIDDKASIVSAIKTTKLTSMYGPIDFTAPVADRSHHPQLNCYTAPTGGAQWQKTTGKWPIDKIIVFSADPDIVQAQAAVLPLG